MTNNNKKKVTSSSQDDIKEQEKAENHGRPRTRGCIFVSETVHNWADFEKRRELDKRSGS